MWDEVANLSDDSASVEGCVESISNKVRGYGQSDWVVRHPQVDRYATSSLDAMASAFPSRRWSIRPYRQSAPTRHVSHSRTSSMGARQP